MMLALVKCLEGKGEEYLTFMRACMRVRVCVYVCVCMHACLRVYVVIAPVDIQLYIHSFIACCNAM